MSESSTFVISLVETGDEGSAFRTQNIPGEKQRRHLVDRGSEFTVQGDLVKVIHGRFSPGGGPATLIVAEFKFISHKNSRRFREATIELLFADSFDSKSKGFQDPEVARIAPMGKSFFNSTQEEWTSKCVTSATGEAGSLVKLGGSVSWETSKSFEKEYRESIDGAMRIEGRNYGTRNQARWNLLENASRRDGIPSLLRCAILLKRKDDECFFATIRIEAKVDTLHSLHSTLRSLLGKIPKDDPVFFDPELEPMGDIPTDMDIENLSDYDLTKLSVVESTNLSFACNET